MSTETSAWRVVLADVNGDGTDEAIYAGYDGRVICLNRKTGRTLWSADVGGFPYCLTTADLDGDHRPEILVTSASLALSVFSPRGKLLWTFSSGAPLHAVTAGRLLGGTAMQVVCGGNDMMLYLLDAHGRKLKELPVRVAPNIRAINHLAVGDVTGDRQNELCLTNGFGIVRLLNPRTGKTLWNSRDYSRRFIRDLVLWDVDHDGKQEILLASNRVELLDGTGTVRWRATAGVGRGRGYRMPLFAPVDVDGDGRREMAVLYGPELSVFNGGGKRLYHQRCASYYLTSIAGHQPASDEVVLGSVVGADRNLYAVRFGHTGPDQFASFEPRWGYLHEINTTLAGIRRQVLQAPTNPRRTGRHYTLWVGSGSPPLNQVSGHGKYLKQFREAYPYPNLRFAAFVQYRQPGHQGQGRILPVSQLMQVARALESQHVTHVLAVAHGLDPFMEVETVKQWLEAAPTSCRGIMMDENSYLVIHQADGDPRLFRQIDRFIDRFMLPVMELCLAKHKRFYLMEKQMWWVGVPAVPSYARRIFAEKYRSIIVPMVEESNSRCPEWNLAARVGLWRSGIVSSWGMNIIDDELRASTLYEYNLGEADAILRQSVASAALGATEFKLGKLMYLFLARGKQDRPVKQIGQLAYRRQGLLAFDTFVHMLGKGLLVVPTPDEISGVSPIAFRFQRPAEGFWQSARMTDPAAIAEASRGGLFSGYDWGYTRTDPNYASAFLMNVPRHAHQFIPETPYGLPLILPAWASRTERRWTSTLLDTNGVGLRQNGRWISAKAARSEILRTFTRGAEQLPWTVTGVFAMGRRSGPKTYRVVLVDPGYLTPSEHQAVLAVHPPSRLKSARDVLRRKDLSAVSGRLTLRVPAGAFRLIDLVLDR